MRFPPEFRQSPPAGGSPATAAVPAQEEERDENGRYVYHPSFIDPPVDESELDEDGLTEQDRADLAVLRETYDRIARRWQALSPRARNKRLLARGGTIPLAGLVHISAATRPNRPRIPLRPRQRKVGASAHVTSRAAGTARPCGMLLATPSPRVGGGGKARHGWQESRQGTGRAPVDDATKASIAVRTFLPARVLRQSQCS